MSSRLLTMKFMQRAAASSSSPQAKTDTAAMKAATAEENAKREAATYALRPRADFSAGRDVETQWELSFVRQQHQHQQREGGGLKVAVGLGLSELQHLSDESDEEEGEEAPENAGRLVFGDFRKKNLDSPAKKEPDGSDDSDSDSGADDDHTPRREKVEKRDLLRGLTSISNAGNQFAANLKCHSCGKTGHKAAECPKAECYACGGLGHMSNDCQSPRRKRKEADGNRDNRPRKTRKSM